MKNWLKVRDRGDVLLINFEDLVKYHGRSNIGGVALAFKVLEYVFSKLSPHEVPQREKVEIFTAFAGSGAVDGFEMLTRAVTQNRFRLDETFEAPGALPAVTGQFYFRITYRGKTLAVTPRAGLIPDRFFALSRKNKAGEATSDDIIEFQGMKEALADALMAANAEDLFEEL
jgi:hypothetical protein